MPTTIRMLAIAFATIGSLALVACSSSEDENAYVDEVNEIQLRAVDAVNDTASVPDSKGELAAALESATAALDDAIADLGELDVPEEAEGAHEKFVAGVEQLRDSFTNAVSEIKNASLSELLTVAVDIQSKGAEAVSEIDAAIDQINEDLG